MSTNANASAEKKTPAEIREVKNLITAGKAKGFLTVEEVNDALPADMVSSDQLDSVLSIFDDMDIEIVDSEEEGKQLKSGAKVKERAEERAVPAAAPATAVGKCGSSLCDASKSGHSLPVDLTAL